MKTTFSAGVNKYDKSKQLNEQMKKWIINLVQLLCNQWSYIDFCQLNIWPSIYKWKIITQQTMLKWYYPLGHVRCSCLSRNYPFCAVGKGESHREHHSHVGEAVGSCGISYQLPCFCHTLSSLLLIHCPTGWIIWGFFSLDMEKN